MSDQNTEMSLDEAFDVIVDRCKNFDSLDTAQQMQLISVVSLIEEKYNQMQQKQKEIQAAQAAARRKNARSRKEYRDQVIPKWCQENLKPGMIVKVKASSATKFREIEQVNGNSLTGRHVRYIRRRDPGNHEITYESIKEGYITDHMLKNVQGVVMGFDHLGRPRVIPIMELVEGEQQT